MPLPKLWRERFRLLREAVCEYDFMKGLFSEDYEAYDQRIADVKKARKALRELSRVVRQKIAEQKFNKRKWEYR